MLETEQPLVIGLGEVLWDCFGDSCRPGGAPANVAFHAQQLGCRGMVCSRVGEDALGDELCRYLDGQGLDTTLIQRDALHPTSTVTVDASSAGAPTFVFQEDGAWDYLECDDVSREAMSQASAVCFGTLAQRSDTSRESIHRLLASAPEDCLIVYDVNLRQNWYALDRIERSLARATIVKLNDHEVDTLAPMLNIGSTSPQQFARAIRERFSIRMVCITRAERGCVLMDAGQTVDVPGVRVDVADAVGAGDAFTAALIVSQLKGLPLETTAQFANQVGALVAGRPGAMPPLRKEIAALEAGFQT